MWIPYDIRGTLKAESDADSIRASQADDRRRDFIVGFFVRNPVTQTWELDVVAPAGGEDVVVEDIDGGTMTLRLCGNDAGKLAEIVMRQAATSAGEALAVAHDALQRRLLRYVVETGRGMAMAGWRIADLSHGALWRCTPFRPSALQLDHQALAPVGPDLQPLVELFQRARHASDPATRLLAAYAVLAAAVRGHPALSDAGVGDFRVTREMLVHAGAMTLEGRLLGRSLGALLAVLQPEHDRLIGPGGLLVVATGDLLAQQTLGRLANLADLAAHRLLERELDARDRVRDRARDRRGAGPASRFGRRRGRGRDGATPAAPAWT